ncbi:MAG TPA: transposase [Thermoflexia bacterium]|nr:transposase [Thermoflexia bacterium]
MIDAFSRQDLDAAWHFAKRFGYKVHMLICRDALLPVMFLVTPANRNDAPWAVPLLELFRRCFALPVRVVRADAAYFTCFVLRARPVIDINPRRRGKKALATLAYISTPVGTLLNYAILSI